MRRSKRIRNLKYAYNYKQKVSRYTKLVRNKYSIYLNLLLHSRIRYIKSLTNKNNKVVKIE